MPKSKVSSNPYLLGHDLLFHLTYLSAVAAAGVSRSGLFRMASQLPSSVSPYFQKVYVLAEKTNLDYSEACRLVGEWAPSSPMKSLLLRLSSALTAGEAEQEFFEREARVQADTYSNEYEGKLESLHKYTDAFTAITISAALILVVAVVSMLIYSTSPTFIMALVVLSVGVTGIGVYMIRRTAPWENKALKNSEGPPRARLLARLFRITVPLSLVLPVLLSLSGLPAGVLLLMAGFILLPLGILAGSYDRMIDRKDLEVSTFLRALGSVATAIGTTLPEAMDRLDRRSFTALGHQIKQLQARLSARIDSAMCWRRFATDSGSTLIDRSIAIFQDGINQGGEAAEVGSRSSLMAMKVSFLRAKRHTVSFTFGYLTMAMHATIAGLLVFIISIVQIFSRLVAEAGGGTGTGAVDTMLPFFSFKPSDLQIFNLILIPVLIIFSLANAGAAQVADGGYKFRFFYFLSITLAMSGISLLVVPAAVEWLFKLTPVK